MGKQNLLKEYIQLLFETGAAAPPGAFQLVGPVKTATVGQHGEHTIYREFPLQCGPDVAAAIGVGAGADELEGDVLDSEHEITFDCDIRYVPGRRSMDRYQPDDPEEVDLEGWTPVTLDGIALTPEDADSLKAFLGDLTDKEAANITNSYEPPERDYGDDY